MSKRTSQKNHPSQKGFGKVSVPTPFVQRIHPEMVEVWQEQKDFDRLWFESHPGVTTMLRHPFQYERSSLGVSGSAKLVLVAIVQVQPGSRVRKPIWANEGFYLGRGGFKPATEVAQEISQPIALSGLILGKGEKRALADIRQALAAIEGVN
ncbi:MAG: hypothetical protein HC769_21725 [Cyanobacteria bacterium CRU_2_1]|nr:hypothetical protein [Cyanobacteria bacterium CRU_2_1]